MDTECGGPYEKHILFVGPDNLRDPHSTGALHFFSTPISTVNGALVVHNLSTHIQEHRRQEAPFPVLTVWITKKWRGGPFPFILLMTGREKNTDRKI